MLYRLAIASALGLALTTAADAQTAQVLPSCGSASIPVGPGGRLYVDQAGNLCTANAGAAGTVTLGAGTNTIGNAVPAASAANIGITPAFTIGGSSIVGKATAGNLYGFSVTAGATAGYLAIINAAAAPAASAAIAPMECIPVPVNGYVARRQDIPDRYTVGVVALFSSSCQTYTAVSPQVISLVVQ